MPYEEENGKGASLDWVDLRHHPYGRLLFQETDYSKTGRLRPEGEFSASNGRRQKSICGGKPKISSREFDQREVHVLSRRKKPVRMVC